MSLVAGVLIGRWLAGHDVDRDRDHQRTNASAFYRGTEASGRASRASYRPHAQRAALRLAGLVALVAVVVGWSTDATSTATTLRVGFWALVVFGLWAMIERSHRYSHFREWIVPLSKMLGERLGHRGGYPTEKIVVPTNHLTDPDQRSTVRLPEGFSAEPAARKRLVKVVAERLGHGAAHDGDVDMAGAEPVLWVAAQPAPPDHVGLADMVEHLGQATDDRLFLGLGRRRTPMWLSWDLDSPHLALSFGSGAGKSTLVRLLAAQTLRLGGRVVIFDIAKEGDSHGDWVRDEHGAMLPGVEVYIDVEEGHDALCAWADEQRRRSRSRWDRTGEEFQRTLVVLEELNSTMPLLKAYWSRIKVSGDPPRPPSWDAILSMVCTGRAVKMNVVAVAQQLTARSLGGGEVRENFGLRALSRFTANTCKMLIPEVSPVPRSSRHKGRLTLAIDGEASDVQAGYLTVAETIEWSLGGVAQPVRQEPRESFARANVSVDLPHEAGQGRHLAAVPDRAEVTITDFAERAGLTTKTVRNWRDRDPGFPAVAGVGPRNASLYRLDELEAYAASQAKATVG